MVHNRVRSGLLIRSACLALMLGGCAAEDKTERPEVSVFDTTMEWSWPRSSTPGRMKMPDGLYRAAWAQGEGQDRLVVLRRNPQDSFGKVYDVAVIDKAGRSIRRGQVRCGEEVTPYCLVEIRTANEAAPPEVRDRWVLALGVWDNRDHFRPELPVGLKVSGSSDDEVASRNFITVEPVRWGDEADWARGVGVLYATTPFEARSAEPAKAWPIP